MEIMTILGLYFFVTGMVLIGLVSRMIFKSVRVMKDKRRAKIIRRLRTEWYMKQMIQWAIIYHLLWFYVWSVNLLTRTVDAF